MYRETIENWYEENVDGKRLAKRGTWNGDRSTKETVDFEYDSEGRVSKETESFANEFGSGKRSETVWAYDPARRSCRSRTEWSGTGVSERRDYEWEPNEDLKRLVAIKRFDAATGISETRDALGRRLA